MRLTRNLISATVYGSIGTAFNYVSSCVDSHGYHYACGTLNLGNYSGLGLTKIGTQDLLVVKHNANGAVVWAKNFGGSGTTFIGRSVDVDGSGNVYVIGYINGNLSTPSLTKQGTNDVVLIKLSGVDGSILWTRSYYGTSTTAQIPANGKQLVVDINGNSYFSLTFSGGNLSNPSQTRVGTQDVCVICVDSSGTTSWANVINGLTGITTYPGDIRLDRSGNVFLGTYRNGNWGTPSVTSGSGLRWNVVKYNSSGTYQWTSTTLANAASGSAVTPVLALDPTDDGIYIGFSVSANTTSPSVTKVGTVMGLIVKLDSSGAYVNNRTISGSTASVWVKAIEVDSTGKVYVCCANDGTSGLSTPATVSKVGSQDVAIFSWSGTTYSSFVRFSGSSSGCQADGLRLLPSGLLAVTGFFNTASLSSPVTFTYVSSANQCSFLYRLKPF